MTVRTWWFTPSIDHIDAQAHPVVLLDYRLAHLDVDGKPHLIVEGEGSLVVERRYSEWSDSYEPASFARERFNLIWDALAALENSHRNEKNVAIAILTACGLGASITLVPNSPPLFLSSAALMAIGWGASIRRLASPDPIVNRLVSALHEARRDLGLKGY